MADRRNAMWTPSFGSPRHVETTIPCHQCGHAVTARRLCREVRIECPECGEKAPLEAYAQDMDDILEEFLQAVFCDRM
jgi:ribosomal protein L37E